MSYAIPTQPEFGRTDEDRLHQVEMRLKTVRQFDPQNSFEIERLVMARDELVGRLNPTVAEPLAEAA